MDRSDNEGVHLEKRTVRAHSRCGVLLHKATSEHDEEGWVMFRDRAHDFVTAEMVVAADEFSKGDRMFFRRWGRSVRGTSAGALSRRWWARVFAIHSRAVL